MGLAENFQEKWESFLQWSDEKGMPFRGISDSLEEKGIPAMPFFMFLVFLLIAGVLYSLFSTQAVGLISPSTTAITLTLSDSSGKPVPNAEVSLVSRSNDGATLNGKTDKDGTASFSDVKISSSFIISAIDNEGNTLKIEDDSIDIIKNREEYFASLASELVTPKASLTVEITGGPQDAQKITSVIVDDVGFPVIAQPAQLGNKPIFIGLDLNREYLVKVQSTGFKTENRKITLTSDQVISVALKENSVANKGSLKITVLDIETGKPLKGASVSVIDSQTGVIHYNNLLTSENGQTEPLTDFDIGKKVKVVATFKGYSESEEERTIDDDTKVEIELGRISEAELKSIKAIIKDESGSAVVNPIVKVYNSKNTQVYSANPIDGVAIFGDVGSDDYFIVASKNGFLPSTLKDAQKGNTYTLTLKSATSGNSGKVKVQVENQNEEAVPQAMVSLFDSDGYPLGVGEKISGNDGIASFDEVPLQGIYAKASLNGRIGSSSVFEITAAGTGEEENTNLLKVSLKPAKGRAVVLIKDHFTGKTVEGAKIEFSPSEVEFSSEASCITKNGRCTVSLLEGSYIAVISANKYDTFTSSEFSIKPNVDNKVNFGIISSEISDKSKITFLGVFNLQGDLVNSLSPASTYNAKFAISRPKVKILKSQVQVRLGNENTLLQNEFASLIGYDAPGAVVATGIEIEKINSGAILDVTEPSASPTATVASATPSASLNLADEPLSPDAFKYVNFDFLPFEGSKEIMVQFKTKAISTGKVDLQYRVAHYSDKEVLRDPVDNSAASGALVSNMLSKSLQISFEGKCENNLCLQSNFEGKAGSIENNFEAAITETFTLNFKTIAPKGSAIELSAPNSDQTIALTEGISGTSKAALKTTEDRQILSLVSPNDNAEGQFTLQARRLANNVDLLLTITNGENTISKTQSLRIVGEKPDLKVTYNVIVDKAGGKTLKALKDNKVVFSVVDSLGLPLKNAFVSLGSGADALGGTLLEGQLQEAKDGTITYEIDNVNPTSVGSVAYKIVAEGFKPKSGSIPVAATKLFDLSNNAISLSVSNDDEKQDKFSIRNLLSNELRVDYTLTFATPKYTDISLDAGSDKVRGLETNENSLIAAISESVLKISATPQTLTEKIVGKVNIKAKLGSSEQTESVPFVVNTNYRQEDLNKLWGLSSDSIGFSLEPPKTKDASQTISVTNQGPYAIIVNHQSATAGVFISPLSKTLAAGETFEFTVNAKASTADSCRFEDEVTKGKIDFFATTQGITSKKSVSMQVSVVSSENCGVKNGLRVSLPVAFSAQIPAGSRTKYNKDGSLLVELPSKEKFRFDSGAQISASNTQNAPSFPAVSQGGGGSYINVPAGTYIEASPSYIKQSALQQQVSYAGFNPSLLDPRQRPFSSNSYQLAFPFTTYLDFDTGTEFSKQGSQKIASIDDFDIYFPASVPLVRGRSVQERRATLPPNAPVFVQLTPFVNSQQSLEVRFPVDATFIITESVRIRKDDFTGARAIQFRSGTTISLPSDAIYSTDPAAQGGGGDLANELRKITIPGGSAIMIPAPFAYQIDREQKLSLPFKIQFKVPRNDRINVNLDSGGLEAKTISTEIYEVAFTEGSTRVGVEFADGSRVIEAIPLAPISIRPTDFGVVGIKRKMPVSFTMQLPSSSSVKRKGTFVQILFDNGNRMLLEGIDVKQKEFEAKEVEVPAGSYVTFSANQPSAGDRMIEAMKSDFGQEKFTIYIPAQTTYHFPISNNVEFSTQLKQVINGVDGYQVDFPLDRLSYQKVDDSNDVVLTITDSAQGVSFTQIDPKPQGKEFEFQFSFPVTVQIPSEAFIAPRSEAYVNELYTSFRMTTPTEIRFSDPDSGDEFWFLATRVLAKDRELSEDDFISDPKTFVVPEDTLIVPTIQQDDDKQFLLHAKFGKDVAFGLPSTTADFKDKENIIEFGNACKQVQVKVGDRKYFLPYAKKVDFPDNARMLPIDADPEKPRQIIVKADEEIVFEICSGKFKDKKFGSITDTVDALVAFVIPKDSKEVPGKYDVSRKEVQLDFTDADASQKKDVNICVLNYGFSDLVAEMQLEENKLRSGSLDYRDSGYVGGAVGPGLIDSINRKGSSALKSVIRPNIWVGQEAYMKLPSVELARQSCETRTFKIQLGVPSQYLDEDGCIAEEFKNKITDPERDGTYLRIDGTYNGMPVSQKIGIVYNLKKENKCVGSLFKQFRSMLKGFFVNYDSNLDNVKFDSKMALYFKDVGHTRYISAVNNLDQKTTYKITGDSNKLGCLPSSGTIAPSGTLEPGEGKIIECKSLMPGTGKLVFTPYDSEDKPLKDYIRTVNFEIFSVEAGFKDIYSSSSMGDLAPQAARVDAGDGTTQPSAPTIPSTAQPQAANHLEFSGITAVEATDSVFAYDPFPARKASFADATVAKDANTASDKPISEKLPTNAMQCQTNFCSSDQVEAAFTGFTDELVSLVNNLYADKGFPESLNTFCERTQSKSAGYKKSIIIQAANAWTQLSNKDIETIVDKQFKAGSIILGGGIETSDLNIKGCGIYVVQARLNICNSPGSKSKEDWLRESQIEFKTLEKKACDETVANAPLLLAERSATEPIVGRVQNSVIGFADRENPLEAGGVVGALQTVQLFNIGPYKESPNKKDLSNIDSIYESFYKTPRSETIVLAEPYNAGKFCAIYGVSTMGAVYGAAIGSVALSAWSNIGKALTIAGIPEAISNVPYLVKSAYYMGTTLSLCTVSIAQQAIYQPKDTICQIANDCIAGGLAGGMESLFTAVPGSGTGKIFAKKFITELVQTAGVTAIIDAGLLGYNAAIDADVPYYVPTPVAYGVARIYRTFGTKAFFQDYLMRNGYGRKEASDISKKVTSQLSKPLTEVGALKDLTEAPDKLLRRINANLPADKKISSLSQIESWDELFEKLRGTPDVSWDLYKKIDPSDYKKLYGPVSEFQSAKSTESNLKFSIKQLEGNKLATNSKLDFISGPNIKENGALRKQYVDEIASLDSSLISSNAELADIKKKLNVLKLDADDAFETMLKKSKARFGSTAKAPGDLFAEATKSKVDSLDDLLLKNKLTQSQYDDLLKKAKDLQEVRATKLRNKLGGEYSSLLENNARLRSIFQVVLPMLFHIDVRPIQGALDYRYVNHIVAYSGKDPIDSDGSMSRICVMNYANNGEECTSKIDPNELCKVDYAACFHLVKGRKFSTEDQGYALFVGVNKGIDFKKVSESVFLSSVPPLTGKELGNNKIGVGYFDDVGKLPVTAEDQEIAIPGTDGERANDFYETLRINCQVNGYCPGKITSGYFTQALKDKIDSDAVGAINQMKSDSGIK